MSLCVYQLSGSVKHNGNECRFVVVLLVMQIGPDWKCVENCDSALVNTAHTSGTKVGRPCMMQQRVLACIFINPNGVLVVDTCVAAAVPESLSPLAKASTAWDGGAVRLLAAPNKDSEMRSNLFLFFF